MKKLVSSAFIFILLAPSLAVLDGSLPDRNDFIFKSYGTLSPDELSLSCTPIGKYRNFNIEFSGIDSICRLTYRDTNDSVRIVGINITNYSDNRYLLNKIILIHNKVIENTKFISQGKGTLLHYCQKKGFDSFSWISEGKLIYFNSIMTEINAELLEDYLTKYPPTMMIKKSDFDLGNINKVELEKYFDIINEGEIFRASSPPRPKYETYLGVIAQCDMELNIRYASNQCMSGEETKDQFGCPIALNFNDAERKAQWQALRDKAMSGPVIFDNEQRPWKCMAVGFPSFRGEVIKKLNFTRDELIALQESEIPEKYKLSIE